MNLAKISQHLGQLLKLQPPASVWASSGTHPIDDVWKLVDVPAGQHVELRNERTGHIVRLAPDHVHHFTSSPIDQRAAFAGWLELIVSIDLSEAAPKVTPIPSGVARTLVTQEQPPLRARIESVLNAINPQLCASAKPGLSLSAMISDHNLRDLTKLASETGFEELLSIRPNGNVAMGYQAGAGGQINDLDQSGMRHGYNLQFRRW